jgi:hypothetical protein
LPVPVTATRPAQLQEGVVEPLGDLLQGGGLAADDLAGVSEPVGVGPAGRSVADLQGHADSLPPGGRMRNSPEHVAHPAFPVISGNYGTIWGDYTERAAKCNRKAVASPF